MIRTLLFTLVTAGLIAMGGCKKEEASTSAGDEVGDKAGAKTDPPEADPAKKDPPDSDEAAGMVNKMKHCPSAVEGSKTKVEKTDKAVVVTIVGEGAGVAQIQERAKYLSELAIKEPDDTSHSGQGTGGGKGKCPVVTTDAKLTVENAEGGVKITLTPSRPDLLDRVFSVAQERTELLSQGVVPGGKGDGTGGGKGEGAGTGGGKGEHSGGGEGANSGGGKKGAGAATPVAPDKAAPAKKPAPAKKAPAKKAAKKDEGGW